MRVFLSIIACLIVSPAFGSQNAVAASCNARVTNMKGSGVLSTSTFYARPGQEQALYNAVAAQNQSLAKHHLQTYTLYRGEGGTRPAVFWEMTFPNMAAHDAWFKKANAMTETASEKALDKQADSATLRWQHAHYVFHDGFTEDSSACK